MVAIIIIIYVPLTLQTCLYVSFLLLTNCNIFCFFVLRVQNVFSQSLFSRVRRDIPAFTPAMLSLDLVALEGCGAELSSCWSLLMDTEQCRV